MAFFFLPGLRHITILKLLGVGEEVGGVLELFPINGIVLFYNSMNYYSVILDYMKVVGGLR